MTFYLVQWYYYCDGIIFYNNHESEVSKMNCMKCYQEIPEGSKFCPYCGADQTATPDAGNVNEQPESTAQPEVNTQAAGTQPEEAPQASAPDQQETNTQHQDSYNMGGQGAYNYGNSSQNDTYPNNYQNNTYQNGNYQDVPPYQQNPGETVNWVPYLVLSIISTLCCCIPFGIAAIVFSAKINSAVTAGNIEEAKKAAKTAKIWIIVAVVAGLLASIMYLVITTMIGTGSYYYYY